MNAEQFERIQSLTTDEAVIHVDELGTEERILIYGYNHDRYDVHVYLQGGMIHCAVYDDLEDRLISFEIGESMPCSVMAPSKRVIPAACDFQFIMLMMAKGEMLPFAKYVGHPQKQFYGKLYEDLDISQVESRKA